VSRSRSRERGTVSQGFDGEVRLLKPPHSSRSQNSILHKLSDTPGRESASCTVFPVKQRASGDRAPYPAGPDGEFSLKMLSEDPHSSQ